MLFTGQSLQEVNHLTGGERSSFLTGRNFSSRWCFSVKLSPEIFFRPRGISPCAGATSIVTPKAQNTSSFHLRVWSFWADFFLELKMSFMVENAFQGLSGVKNNLSKHHWSQKISNVIFFFFWIEHQQLFLASFRLD